MLEAQVGMYLINSRASVRATRVGIVGIMHGELQYRTPESEVGTPNNPGLIVTYLSTQGFGV